MLGVAAAESYGVEAEGITGFKVVGVEGWVGWSWVRGTAAATARKAEKVAKRVLKRILVDFVLFIGMQM